jgi:hypothetical protein
MSRNLPGIGKNYWETFRPLIQEQLPAVASVKFAPLHAPPPFCPGVVFCNLLGPVFFCFIPVLFPWIPGFNDN